MAQSILSHSKLYDKEVWKKYFSGQYQFAGVRLGPPNYEKRHNSRFAEAARYIGI